MTSDNELLMLIQERIEEADEILYKRYQKIIRKRVYDHKNIIDYLGLDISEVYIDCLSVYLDALQTYNDSFKSSFYSFVILLVDRKLNKMFIKEAVRRKRLGIATSFDKYANSEEQNKLDPLNIVSRYELINDANKTIDKLNNDEVEVIDLLLDDYSYETIAKSLNKNYKQIYWIIEKLRFKFKHCLANM